MKTVTFFDKVSELQELTGLPDENALWKAGFELDDWDFGFVSDTEWTDGWWGKKAPYYEHWMMTNMGSHCLGPRHYEFGGKHYYMLYHA